MGKKSQKIDVPDPREIIQAETEANRTDAVTPFGTSRWEGSTQVTELSPEMDALRTRMFDIANQDSQRVEPPSWVGDLGAAIAGRVGERYGLPQSTFSGNKPQGQMQAPDIKPPEQSVGPSGPSFGADFGQQPPPSSPPPSYGGMPPGPPMDPGQLEQLRQRMSGGNNHFFNPRIK